MWILETFHTSHPNETKLGQMIGVSTKWAKRREQDWKVSVLNEIKMENRVCIVVIGARWTKKTLQRKSLVFLEGGMKLCDKLLRHFEISIVKNPCMSKGLRNDKDLRPNLSKKLSLKRCLPHRKRPLGKRRPQRREIRKGRRHQQQSYFSNNYTGYFLAVQN